MPRWFDAGQVLSYNKLINILLGSRGTGKTVDLIKRACLAFIRKGHKFVYVRRHAVELDIVKDHIFDDMEKLGKTLGWFDPETKFEVTGNDLFINGECCGMCIPLSRAGYYKSVPFPDYYTIIYDEFIPESGQVKYLKNEIDKLKSLIETVGRLRDIRVFLVANNASLNNPYFDEWDLKPQRGAKFVTSKDAVIQYYTNEEHKAEKLNTKFGQMLNGTTQGAYILDNVAVNDNMNFVEPMKGKSVYSCTLRFNGHVYGVYHLYERGYYHINKRPENTCRLVYAFTCEDHTPNVMLMKTAKNHPKLKRLLLALQCGQIRFDTIATKDAMFELFGYL